MPSAYGTPSLEEDGGFTPARNVSVAWNEAIEPDELDAFTANYRR